MLASTSQKDARKENTMFQRFFVPLDGSARAEKALPVAASLARASAGTVILARVIVPSSNEEYGANVVANEHAYFREEHTEARAYLDEVVDRYDQVLEGLHLIVEAMPAAAALLLPCSRLLNRSTPI